MRLVLARHGQTEMNRSGHILGRVDSPLTPAGRIGAEALGRALAGAPLAAAFSSPLGRARATAEILVASRGLAVQVREALAELSAGEWEGRLREEVLAPGRNIRPDWSFSPPGGESYAAAEARLGPFLAELRGMEGDILAVGHFGIGRVVLKLWLGLAPEEARRVALDHHRVYLLEPGGGVTWLDATGRTGAGLVLEGGAGEG